MKHKASDESIEWLERMIEIGIQGADDNATPKLREILHMLKLYKSAAECCQSIYGDYDKSEVFRESGSVKFAWETGRVIDGYWREAK